jgi:hypothetical protein
LRWETTRRTRSLAEKILLGSNGFKLFPFQMAFRQQPGAICVSGAAI